MATIRECREQIQRRAAELIRGHGRAMLARDLWSALEAEGYGKDSIEYALTRGGFGAEKRGAVWYRTLPPRGTKHAPKCQRAH